MSKIKKIWLDFETSGLDEKTCGITQLAFMILGEDGEVLDMGNYDIKPFEGAEIQPTALQVTGKTYDQIMGFEDEAVVLEHFLSIVLKHISKTNKDDNFTIGAYNAQFDVKFLAAWLERNKKNFFHYFNYHTNDPLAMLRILRWQGYVNIPSLKLSAAYKAVFDREFDAHDALADIMATRELYEFLIDNYIVKERP